MSGGTFRQFSLGRIGNDGVRAIIDGLRIIREDVRQIGFDPADGLLTVEVADEATARQVENFVDGMRRTQRLIGRKVLRENRATSRCDSDIDAALATCPDIQILGEGLTGLRGDLLRLFRFFERQFKTLADAFGAEDNHYPAMIPARLLAEVGYFGHFPQHVTLCCHFPDSLPVLEAVAIEAKTALADVAALGRQFASRLAPPGHALTPGVCLPCYCQQRGVVLAPGGVRVLTMQNHVFRYEANSFRPLARAWDFSVRDIVFFGSNADLVRLRAAVMERVFEFCQELDLDVTLELANDPFFLDGNRDKAVYQRMGEVKYELLFRLPHRTAPLAASSFNLHRDFYTSLYDTRRSDGSLAESACMGFGLERWLYGFISQKGLDPAHWPAAVKASLT